MVKSLVDIQIGQVLDKIESNLDAFIAQLNITSLEDLLHIYDDSELCIMDSDGNYVQDIPMNEEVDRMERIMRSIRMKSHSYDIHLHRKLAVKFPSSIQKISHRARAATLYYVKHHIDKNYNKLAPMERAQIDRIVKGRKGLVSSMTTKMYNHIRDIEHTRLAHHKP
jgi:hypothetical protein